MRAYRLHCCIWLLFFLFIGEQCVSLAHGIVHAHGFSPAQVQVQAEGVGTHSNEAWADRLFGHHHDTDACKSYSHWVGADFSPAPALAPLLPAIQQHGYGFPVLEPQHWVQAFVAHYSARAPPGLLRFF